jgi:hypothetical protein
VFVLRKGLTLLPVWGSTILYFLRLYFIRYISFFGVYFNSLGVILPTTIRALYYIKPMTTIE